MSSQNGQSVKPCSPERIVELIEVQEVCLAELDRRAVPDRERVVGAYRDTRLALLELSSLRKVKQAADALVAHIGCHGEINARHPLTLDCLEALNATGAP